ncbi:MAG: hypothetical protein MZV64_36965 [Ignavibacteriales bacterium]|nr:hypothetical protein [Ignavibacteriales bacterium]
MHFGERLQHLRPPHARGRLGSGLHGRNRRQDHRQAPNPSSAAGRGHAPPALSAIFGEAFLMSTDGVQRRLSAVPFSSPDAGNPEIDALYELLSSIRSHALPDDPVIPAGRSGLRVSKGFLRSSPPVRGVGDKGLALSKGIAGYGRARTSSTGSSTEAAMFEISVASDFRRRVLEQRFFHTSLMMPINLAKRVGYEALPTTNALRAELSFEHSGAVPIFRKPRQHRLILGAVDRRSCRRLAPLSP